MHLASDYIHPYKDAGGGPARCRVRIYLPDESGDLPVVICSEVPNNPGGGDSRGGDPGQQVAHSLGVNRALARGEYRR